MNVEHVDLNGVDIRFRTLFEQAPFSVQLLALDGRTLNVNKAWETLWQVSEGDGLKDYVLTQYNVLTDPQLAAKGITDYLRRAFAGESVTLPAIAYDPAELGKPGHMRWVKAYAHPVKDDLGQVREVMLIHEDVSAQLQSEQALQASEMRLKQLANTIPQLAWMADPEGWIHWYNDRWYDYTGMSAEQMQGWGWESVHDPAELPKVLERWKHSLASGEPFQMTFPLRGKDGRFRPFFTLVAPLKDASGKVVQWFGTNTDVSALHDAEQGLRRAEERLRLATHAGNIGIWEWDFARDIVMWSDEVYRLHELPLGSFSGGAQAFAALVHPDDRDMMRRKIETAVRHRDGFSAEFRSLLPDGGVKWLSTWARVPETQGGNPDRMVGATISIDAYKKAEAALRDNDRRKDEFLAMLAHELRNPLAPISTAADLLQLRIADENQVRRASEIISRQVAHIVALIDDLLDVSRVTRGLIQLDRSVVDLKSVVTSAVEQVQPTMQARGHVLTIRTGAEDGRVLGDSTRLVQAIVNVLNNAAKYTPQGGEISLALNVSGAQACITVEDSGMGIDPALLPHVFDLFTQGARNPGRSEGGLGIGLALVKSIVELHGGQVHAASQGAGAGSSFTLKLPLCEEPEAVPAEREATQEPRTSPPLEVVIVDDNRDAADSLAMLLRLEGHRVTVMYDASSMMSRLQELEPQVFILDIGLPDMDGYTLVRLLRARAGAAVFIALTGYGQEQDRGLSTAAGFDYHFVKPVDQQMLNRVLSAIR